ncbi:autotransporter domain-containing protein [Fusobacterium sp. THCT1E2]
MIEKIMKAVKSGNKKRGRNITIGAVVGFLLSCTAVMGKDNYLWIRENSGITEFNTQKTTDVNGTGGNWNKANPYNQNEWNGSTYINNAVLLSSAFNATNNSGYEISCGLKLSGDLSEFNFINNGSITAGGDDSYGIYNIGTMESLTNDGLIVGNYTYGIYNIGTMESLINNGSIISKYSAIYTSAMPVGILINNGLITSRDGIGINVLDVNMTTLINNGVIIAGGRGISLLNLSSNFKMTTLTNTGLIAAMGGEGISVQMDIPILTNSGVIIGIRRDYQIAGIVNMENSIETLKNIGLITGKNTGSDEGNGIHIHGKITALINSGLITGKNTGSGESYGITHTSKIVSDLVNNGLIRGIITGSGNGYGVYTEQRIITLTNIGIIYGKTNAIWNYGTIDYSNNYGILATKGSSAINGTITNKSNYGLYIEDTTGIVTAGGGGIKTVKVGDLERDMTIKNAPISGGSGIGTSTDSFAFSGTSNEFNNSVLNGKSDTLKVSGTDREVKGSIINAYGTEVAFGEADKKLTLSGTVVNGGVEETNKIAVSGSGGGDTLILQSGEVRYVGGSTGTQNTIINGNIAMEGGADTITVDMGAIINGNVDMGDGDDVLNIANGGKINGTLDGKTGNDTLNFDSPVTRTSNSDEIRILYDIKSFENININTNVTLFEKTIDDNDEIKDLEVTGAGDITIRTGGILTLRLDTTRLNGSKIIGHALYGNTGIIKSENGGKLLLALNGAGNKSIVSFGDTTLGGSLVTAYETKDKGEITFATTSLFHEVKRVTERDNEVIILSLPNLPTNITYEKLNEIYHSILSVDELRNFSVDNDEKLSIFLGYLNDIYAGNPYSYSSELSRKSTGMFREIVTENQFKANTGKWMIYGGLTHVDGGTKDTYYGKGYYTYDIGSSDMDADTKITGVYMLGEYGISDTLTSGVIVGGNKLKSDLSNGSKIDGSALYLGTYAKKYIGNLKVTAGAGLQYGDYDADRLAVNKVASDVAKAVMKYSDNYNDMTYNIYLNGRYSHNIGDNLFLEPYGTLSYTYIDQDGADEGNKALAIETDSKSFDYTSAKVGADLKKVIPHEKGKSTLSAGISYAKLLNGADEEYITGRFKGENASDFDILVAHKNEHSLGLNAKYALELENGVLLDVKGSYAVERDSHNGVGKNKTKGEWIVGAGLGYKF